MNVTVKSFLNTETFDIWLSKAMVHAEDNLYNINTQSFLGMRHKVCLELYQIEKIIFR